jgi:hypothetical protein
MRTEIPIPLPLTPADAERFVKSFHLTANGCWEWQYGTTGDGYPVFKMHGKKYLAHRVMYTARRGPIKDQIDHLCRNTRCVNPAHLEDVSCRTNVYRSESIPGRNARKTHCPKGHPFSPENTVRQNPFSRRCRICQREYLKLWKRRWRAAQKAAR